MVIDDKSLVEIAARVPAPELAPASKARMRSALLSSIDGMSQDSSVKASGAWRSRLALASAAALVLLGGLWAGSSEPSKERRSGEVPNVVQAPSLVLVDGIARYEELAGVDNTGPVRLLAGDAVVLSSGASFEVSVDEARLQQIIVLEGHLDVILVDHGRISIQAGQTLRASAMSHSVEIFSSVPELMANVPGPSASVPKASASQPQPRSLSRGTGKRRLGKRRLGKRRSQANRKNHAARAATIAAPSPPATELADESVSSVSEYNFGQGFRAYKKGNFKEAIELLRVVLNTSPSAALSRDARYWTALALVGDGRNDEAVAAMKQFVTIHPSSGRAGEVHGRLGWLLLELGRDQAARASFGRAMQDSRLRVRENAETGLQRLQ